MNKHVVIVSNLYPNRDEPNRGIFIKQLADSLEEEFDITVVCPVPWRPVWFSKLKGVMPLPKNSVIDGITVYYPRHIVIPKLMRFTYGWFMYLSLFPLLKVINKNSSIDLISAHWVYPDGFGAVKSAKKLGKLVTVHALGCDINEYTKYKMRRDQIAKTLKLSDAVVVKSKDLARRAQELGCDDRNVYTVHNGVDSSKFYPIDMEVARKNLNLDIYEKYLIFIGNIQEEKGLIHLIEALSIIDDFKAKLLVIGSGSQEAMIKAKAKELGLSHLIKFIGAVPHDMIPVYLNAANALCLPSLREGCPNIVLESLNCGTPVLASDVGAIPQIITDNRFGLIIPPQSPEAIAKAIPSILKIKDGKSLGFKWYGWQENASKIANIFRGKIGS